LLAAAGALAFTALKRTADLFYTPTTLAERGGPVVGKRIKIGGFVQPGSLEYGEGTLLEFKAVDQTGEIAVVYDGLVPDLFREGQGVVATGAFREDGVFEATRILAKHDEKYEPRELRDARMPAS